MISPVQSHYHESSPVSKEEKLRWEGGDSKKDINNTIEGEVYTTKSGGPWEHCKGKYAMKRNHYHA